MRRWGMVVAMFMGAGIVGAQPQPPDTLWTYSYASSDNDYAYSVACASDNGLVVGGKGSGPDSLYGALLIKLDANGQEAWVHRYPGLSDAVNDVAALSDGGFALAGGCPTFPGMTVVKTDASGITEWSRNIPSSIYGEPGWSIAQSTNGSIAVLGVDPLLPHPDIFLVGLSPDGDSLWTQRFDSPSSYKAGAVIATPDGGFFVGSSVNAQAFAAKLDSYGVIQWSTTLGNAAADTEEVVHAVATTVNGDYLLAGDQTRGSFFTYTPYAARLSATGDTLWTRIFSDYGLGWLYGVQELPDGNIALAGTTADLTDNQFLVLMVDSQGELLWSTLYGTELVENCEAVCVTQDNRIVMAGYRSPRLFDEHDVWVVRTQSLYPQAANERYLPPELGSCTVHPNPFNSIATLQFALPVPSAVRLTLYDVLGRVVMERDLGRLAAGEHTELVDAEGFASGIYFVRLDAGMQNAVRKVALVR